MLNETELKTLLGIAEKASIQEKWTLYVDGSICANVNGGRHSIAKITFPKLPESVLDGRHIAAFNPSTCAELVREVIRLREVDANWKDAVKAGLIIEDEGDGPTWHPTDEVRQGEQL